MPGRAESFAYIITCEHACNTVPARYRPLFKGAQDVLDSHRGYDPGALGVAREMAKRLQAPIYEGEASRLIVELNRSLHHHGLFSQYTRGLGGLERDAIVDRYYRPFREAVCDAIRALLKANRRVVHVSVHSFTPELDGEVRRVECGLLYDPGRDAEAALVRAWKPRLVAAMPAWRVRCNQPYRGTADGHTTALRKVFAQNLYAGIEIEVNQSLLHSAKQQRAIGQMLATTIPV